MKANKVTKGKLGEFAAMIWLIFRGYIPIEKNYDHKLGQIDLIMKRGRVIAFIEVKLRNDTRNFSLSQNQMNRIKNSAQIFLSQNRRYKDNQMSFDVVLIQPWKFPVHLKNAY